jgi:hypothetical protein
LGLELENRIQNSEGAEHAPLTPVSHLSTRLLSRNSDSCFLFSVFFPSYL